MKKQRLGCFILAIVGYLIFTSAFASAKTVLSSTLLIPESSPVRIRPADSNTYIEITTLRAIEPDTEIASENSSPFKILCPDLTLIEVLPGKTFACPEKMPEVLFMVEVPPPPPWVTSLDSNRGKDLASLTLDQKEEIQGAQRELEGLDIEGEHKQFLLANLYASHELYGEAIRLLESQGKSVEDPVILRLLGNLYVKLGEYRKAAHCFYNSLEFSRKKNDLEGQAVVLHNLALLFQLFEQREEFMQYAQEAQKLYQKLGYIKMVEQLQKLIEGF